MEDKVRVQCEIAKVSRQVTSQATFQYNPVGPVGSLAAGIPERMQALISMPFNILLIL